MSGRAAAPELPDGLTWVNTRDPVRLSALRGRVVLLHFFSYSNANSIQSLPDLRYLETKYHDGLTVLGIHGPKFEHEREAAHVLKAVNRHRLLHATANDSGFRAWQLYGARAWPAFVVIDATGHVAAVLAGEGRRAELDALIGHLLEEAASANARVFETASPTARAEPKLALRFPGKLLATEQHLYVADTGHNRVLECTHEGRVLRQFGSGNAGFWDGRNQDAGFSEPQGLALSKDALFVADRANHAIRRVRLLTGEVETYAGTGVPGRARGVDLEPRATALSSPWDLALSGERLHIAMAGQHQVWTLDLGRTRLSTLAGTGTAGLVDGSVDHSRFAKPVGLAAAGQMLYVADGESSAVRSIKLLDGVVKTLAGLGLYEAGDADGDRPETIRLQHPSALAHDASMNVLWVADAYNQKLKMLSLRNDAMKTFRLDYRLHEPGGLSVAGGSLWIANTNAHEIVRVDLASGVARRVPVGE